MIEDALVALMTAPGSATAAIIGDRIYPNRLPQGEGETSPLPAVVYHLAAAPREYSHAGPSYLVTAVFQLDLVTDDYSQAQALRTAIVGTRAVPGVLSGRKAVVEWEGVPRKVSIRRIFVRMERDSSKTVGRDSKPDLEGVDASPMGKSLDIEVHFWET